VPTCSVLAHIFAGQFASLLVVRDRIELSISLFREGDIPASSTENATLVCMESNTPRIALDERVRRAAHATGWISVSHDVAPAVAGAVATIIVTWAIAPARPAFSWGTTSFPLLAGAMALIAIYLLVNFVEFGINCYRAGVEWRIEEDGRRQGTLVASTKDKVIKEWARKELNRPKFGVKFAAAFGSVTATYPTRDIDIVVQLEDGSDQTSTKRAAALKGLNRVFREEFGLPLHLQLFLSGETSTLVRFAESTGSLEVLIGEEYWEETFVRRNSTSSVSE
jgi:predicted nucleotidyltransferase